MREGPLIVRSCFGCIHLKRRGTHTDPPRWTCTYFGGFRALADANTCDEAFTPDWCPVPTPREVKPEDMR